MKSQKNTNAILSLLCSGFLFSLYGPLTRITGESFGPLIQAGLRASFRILILIPIIFLFTNLVKKPEKTDWKWFMIIGTAAAATNIFYILAITKIAMGTTMFLFYALGLVSAFSIGRVFYQEKLNSAKTVSLILALAGVLFMFLEKISLGGDLIYLVSAAIAGFAYGAYASFSKKVSLKFSKTQIIFLVAAFEIPIYLICLLFVKEPTVWTSVNSWLVNLLYATIILINGYFIFYGYQHLEAQKASILLLSELIFIVGIGIIFYHEIPTLGELIGSVLILFSLLIPNINFKKSGSI